jgi:integrase
MASIQKTASGYRAQVAVKGERDSQTFRTRREAEAWASARETDLRESAKVSTAGKTTLRAGLEKYRDEVTQEKRGKRWEEVRINAFLRDPRLPLDKLLSDIDPADFEEWRKGRLSQVSDGTLIREMNVISAFFGECVTRWRWLKESPFSAVKRPPPPDHRNVVIHWRQAKAMTRIMGLSAGRPPRTVSQVLAVMFLLALRTGMREGELCNLTWANVYSDYVFLPVTKSKPRPVPLSMRARRLIERMRGWDEDYVFGGIKPETASSLFRKYRVRAGLEGFTFHDCRHTAATMMAKKVDVLTLCKIFGWSNPKMAMVYYNPTPSQMAAQLG